MQDWSSMVQDIYIRILLALPITGHLWLSPHCCYASVFLNDRYQLEPMMKSCAPSCYTANSRGSVHFANEIDYIICIICITMSRSLWYHLASFDHSLQKLMIPPLFFLSNNTLTSGLLLMFALPATTTICSWRSPYVSPSSKW